MAILGVEALNEFVEIGAFQRSLFKREVLVRPQVIDPKFFRSKAFHLQVCGGKRVRWP
jgi:hypothetical protein